MSDKTRQAALSAGLTRPAVARRLNTSVASVRRLEGRLLHPQRSERGVWLFAPEEVERVAATRGTSPKKRPVDEGEIAARVFELFEAGVDLTDVVVELRQPPRIIRNLYDEWRLDLATGHDERKQVEEEKQHERWMRSLR